MKTQQADTNVIAETKHLETALVLDYSLVSWGDSPSEGAYIHVYHCILAFIAILLHRDSHSELNSTLLTSYHIE